MSPTSESDFGIAEDDLFDDPDGFFEDSEGELAISALIAARRP